MYLFDEKCVLFPKLLSVASMRQNILNDFMTENEDLEALPVDFVSTQWVEQSACYLPTYVPLVSGIFGLVWTTMFLMCSSGSRTLTGLQQPWRIIPPVFIFSLSMGCLCTYTSIVTYRGLQELCLKLGEITGSKTCTFAVNVATLAYERRIRGVYQATRLTIFSAWMHTACWLLAALLALVRILLVVDFRLERHEQHLRTVSASAWPDTRVRNKDTGTETSTETSIELMYTNKDFKSEQEQGLVQKDSEVDIQSIYYLALETSTHSKQALLPEEQLKLATIRSTKHENVKKILDDIIHSVNHLAIDSDSSLDISVYDPEESESFIVRQLGSSKLRGSSSFDTVQSAHRLIEPEEAEERAKEFRRDFHKKMTTASPREPLPYVSHLNITPEMALVLEGEPEAAKRKSKTKKSSLKAKGNQTESNMKSKGTQQKVHIEESETYDAVSEETLKPSNSDDDKDEQDDDNSKEDQVVHTQSPEAMDNATQTPKKEKQD